MTQNIIWKITEDKICDGESVGVMSGTNERFKELEKENGKVYFKLYDGDDEHYFSGYVTGTKDAMWTEEFCFGPLDNFGSGYGCTEIKMRNPKTKKMEYV